MTTPDQEHDIQLDAVLEQHCQVAEAAVTWDEAFDAAHAWAAAYGATTARPEGTAAQCRARINAAWARFPEGQAFLAARERGDIGEIQRLYRGWTDARQARIRAVSEARDRAAGKAGYR